MRQTEQNISFKPGLYLHIPFCEHKCAYCDFYSVTNRAQQAQFVDALCNEIELTARQLAPQSSFDTIYFGGGTPSLLKTDQLRQILKALRSHFPISDNCEITLEMNPGATEQKKLPAFKDLGINRLSMGLQSFDDRQLKFLERIHTAGQAVQAFEAARRAGFDNIGLDLIFALPGQSLPSWQKSLQQAVRLNPEHISAYNLIFEPNTPFYRLLQQGKIRQQPEEEELRFFNLTHRILQENGYLHYEVSNFARQPALFSRHNYKYWLHVPYLGFGPSAHSFWKGQRWGNVRSLTAYLKKLNKNEPPFAFKEKLSVQTLEFEHIFLRLRTYQGIDLAYFEKTFARSFLDSYRKTIDDLIESGFARLTQNRFCLTQKGMALADEILQRFA